MHNNRRGTWRCRSLYKRTRNQNLARQLGLHLLLESALENLPCKTAGSVSEQLTNPSTQSTNEPGQIPRRKMGLNQQWCDVLSDHSMCAGLRPKRAKREPTSTSQKTRLPCKKARTSMPKSQHVPEVPIVPTVSKANKNSPKNSQQNDMCREEPPDCTTKRKSRMETRSQTKSETPKSFFIKTVSLGLGLRGQPQAPQRRCRRLDGASRS